MQISGKKSVTPIIVSLALLGASAGQAQPFKFNPKLKPVIIKVQSTPTSEIKAKQSNIVNTASVATNAPLNKGAVLSAFAFNFNNGDHKLNTIGVLQNNGKAEFTFNDQDRNDPFYADAKWFSSPSIKTGSVYAAGGGEFDIPLSYNPNSATAPNSQIDSLKSSTPKPPPPGYTAVLSGFKFERKPGTDANIRTIGVRIDPATNKVRVTLIDDQGTDFRGLEYAVAAGFAMSLAPMGQMEALFGTGAAATAFVVANEFDKQNKRAFAVTVQYAWVPNDLITATGAVSGAGRAIESGRTPIAGEKTALTGFLFNFNNSDHHILQAKIDLSNPSDAANYQDGNGDDPFQYYIDYAVVK